MTPDEKTKIEAAIPHTAPATPQRRRKLLVVDQRGGHATIANTNYAIELLGKSTGAYEVVFSNDLDNLKYDKIRQYDAVILNSTESDVAADPAVREGLLRYVREGGGIGGIHAASWSSTWPELMEMFGATQGTHRTQAGDIENRRSEQSSDETLWRTVDYLYGRILPHGGHRAAELLFETRCVAQ